MLQKSLIITTAPITLMPWDRRRCLGMSICIFVQCILVWIGSITVLRCVWSPDKSSTDFGMLARIMYLYDYEACGHKLRTNRGFANVRLSNNTYGLNVKPIAWTQALVTVSTRLSSKTRKYIELSVGIHAMWMTCAIIFHIILRKSHNLRVLKFVLVTFLYICILMIVFDVSMGMVYISDIQQSLTKNMVLRYSGWNVELTIKNGEDFAGWLPIAAAILWMRGGFILAWNIYSCKFINYVYRKVKKREVKTRLIAEGYLPIPEPTRNQGDDSGILYFGPGENKPYIKDNNLPTKIFYGR